MFRISDRERGAECAERASGRRFSSRESVEKPIGMKRKGVIV